VWGGGPISRTAGNNPIEKGLMEALLKKTRGGGGGVDSGEFRVYIEEWNGKKYGGGVSFFQ